MKFRRQILAAIGTAAFSFIPPALFAAATSSNTIVLDETGVKNLRIETVVAEETTFEESVFSLGRIESIPSRASAVSSRISGRIVELGVSPGDTVQANQVVAKVESRQPGDPPPVIDIRASAGGIVMSSAARLGEPAEPDKALLEIIDLSEVYAIARVPEHQAGTMKAGTKAHIRVAAVPGGDFDGELLRFGNSADRESGTIDAIFRLPNTGGLLRPGMRAEFSIVISKRENVLSVPRAALQGEASKRYVYVKDFDLEHAFIKTPVEVGEMNDRAVEIVSGILPADEVVTRGAYSLSFAGGGSISLKEALDAAHGHEHAEDGSELTPEKRAEMAAKKRAAAGLPPENAGGGNANPVWMYISIVLFVLLLASLFTRKRGTAPEEEEVTPTPEAH
ncbi:efflux RND transporter periplasmic adaptor subunit [Luteolibacter soli]|uniref:Efflux RND transporter periplasmic adaptor subunit n=1 Tax=Luteolibacter soli TaxID=3135280 RepID=A0ABU9AYM1_9BACT